MQVLGPDRERRILVPENGDGVVTWMDNEVQGIHATFDDGKKKMVQYSG